MDITTILREACFWARRSVCYAAVVQQGPDLKTVMVNILQQNAQVMSQRVTANLDAWCGLNVSDREAPNGDNSSTGESPPKKRARLAGAGSGGPVGSSGDPSSGFAPAGSNEDDKFTPLRPQ
ncbi:unnamed protein product [Agarophyton chilense]